MAVSVNAYQAILDEQQKRQKELQESLNTPYVANGSGAEGAMGQAGGYVSPYAEQLQEAARELEGMQFSYDAQKDPNWQIMRKEYLREADRAASDVLAKASAATGGRASSYAVTAASQAADYYKSQMSVQQLALYESAYEKYLNEYATKMDRLELLLGQDETEYTRWLNDKQLEIAEQERAQELKDAAYDRLVKVIANTGHIPSEEELAAGNMSMEEAQAWKKAYDLAASYSGGSGGGSGGSYGGAYYTGGDTVDTAETKNGKVYNNGMSETQIAVAAQNYYLSHSDVAYNSRTMDNWLSANGYTGESAQLFKAYFIEYGGKSMNEIAASMNTGAKDYSNTLNKTQSGSSSGGSSANTSKGQSGTSGAKMNPVHIQNILNDYKKKIGEQKNMNVYNAKLRSMIKNSSYTADQKAQLLAAAGL